MPTNLSQDANGGWRLTKIGHDGPSSLTIRSATIKLNGQTLNLPEITSVQKTVSLKTPWVTPLGTHLDYHTLEESFLPKSVTENGVKYNISCRLTGTPYVPVQDTIEILTEPFSVPCETSEQYTISVTASTSWTAVSNVNWIQIVSIDSDSVTITFSNNEGDDRTGTITVRTTGEGIEATDSIEITQSKCQEEPYLRYTTNLDVCENGYCVDCDDDTTYTVTVDSNIEWTATTESAWIHVTNVTASGFKVSFTNNDGEDRNGTIKIQTTDRSLSSLDKTLEIKQTKCPDEAISILTPDLNVLCETEPQTILVEASAAWTAVTNVDWIEITEITSDSFTITISDNSGEERSTVISAYTIEGGGTALDTINVTQFKCEDTIIVDVDSLTFECMDESHEIHVTASDGVTWTAATNVDWLRVDNPNSQTITVTAVSANETRRSKTGKVTITSSIPDSEPIEITVEQKPTMFFRVGVNSVQFDATGETVTFDVYTNYAFSVNVPASSSSWLTASRSQNTGNNTAWTVTLTALENTDSSHTRTSTVTFSTEYDGVCDWGTMPFVSVVQDEAEPYIPPVPDARFDVTGIYADFPYYAELGGFSHEYSFMSEDFYECCSGFTKGDVGGVVYLMPLHSCAIQVYYDTNVDINNLTYEIEHISPAQPEQEWLEVYLKPEEYDCVEGHPEVECGWSDVDSRDEPYPGDFVLIKTRDWYTGTTLYDDTQTAYVHIKERATGNILRTIPVKCIKVDINGESVKASATGNERDAERNLKIGSDSNPAIGAAGGFVDVWVYTNDSAYIDDYVPGTFIADDNDVNWNKLKFYYPDGTTILPVTKNQDPNRMGYIDKIYDTSCNSNNAFLLKVYVSPNTDYSNKITHGFKLSTENAGYHILDSGNKAQVRIVQDRDHETYRNNYRIVEFYATDGGINPVVDETVMDSSQISGGTCDGSGHSTHPFFKAIYDYGRASSPGTVYTAETLNDNMIIYDEQAGRDILNPNVLEVTNISYQGGSNWIEVNQNYRPTKNQPFEFYIKPNTGYTSNGSSREAAITITYKNCSPQISRTLTITQSYKQVEPATFGVYLWATNSQGDRVGNDVEATVTPNSNKEFSFEILTSSNAEGHVMPYVGDSPEPQYYGGIQDYVSAITSITYTAQNFDFSAAMSLYQSEGIVFPEIANKGSYTIKTYGQAFDLKLLCRDKNDPLVQRILTIHVNAC